MIREEIINYYKAENAKGAPVNLIAESLIKAGWGKNDIEESIASAQTQTLPLPNTPAVVTNINSKVITESDYPVEKVWILKSCVRYIITFGIVIIYLAIGVNSVEMALYLIFIIFFITGSIIFYSLRRKIFHFSI